MKEEVYVSIDIETDGPAPGLNSMLALGAAAFNQEGEEIDTWYKKFHLLPGAYPDPKTQAWWQTQPEALAEVMRNQTDPMHTIPQFVYWCKNLPGKPIAVAWPAAFDFAFVNYYCHKFAGENPLGFACLDIRSFANGLLNYGKYYGLSEKALKKFGKVDTTDLRPHVALDDAVEQGRLFMVLKKHADNQ